ncbi:MAG: hypothetical protein L6Q37_08380 [Bdellovibrionaceae bacterium]|nr:hypothetical protein [Pseudobdellovibrionaceae bacterium]NUM59855.1 hypothetical protein [Pseudobdellovibrionaceae bacterium]
MNYLGKRELSLIILSFYGVVLLFSFQNCGVKGFDIDPSLIRSPNSENQTLPNDNYGSTDLTTIPSGKMLEFKMPSQMEKLNYSHIDIIDSKNYGYSSTLRKFISFYTDSDSYEIIEIPDKDVFFIKSVSAAMPLGGNQVKKNLTTFLVFFSDDNFNLGYGIFNIKDKSWTRIRIPEFDRIQNIMNYYFLEAQFFSSPAFDLNFLVLRETIYSPISETKMTKYYQTFDNSGRAISELTLLPKELSENFYYDLTPANSETLLSKSQKLSLDIKNGTLKTFSNSISSYTDKIFKQDLSGVLYHENNSITEFDFATKTTKKILAPTGFYLSNLRKIDDIFHVFENAYGVYSNQQKYLIRSNNLAPLQISDYTFSYASTNQNLVLFSSDPLASDFKIQIRVINSHTQREVSMCSEVYPLDAHILDMNQTSSNLNAFFPNVVRLPKNIHATTTTIAMDKTCSNLYLGLIYLSADYLTQTTQLYKYNIRTSKIDLVLDSSSPKGISDSLRLLGFKDSNLIYQFNNTILSTDKKEEIGKYISDKAHSNEIYELGKFNYNNFKFFSNDKLFDFIVSNDGNITFLNQKFKLKSQPNSYLIPLINDKYMIISREKDQDTTSSSSVTLYLYNEQDVIISKKSFNIPAINVSIGTPISYFDTTDTTNTFQAFTILGSLNREDQSYFLVINTTDFTYKVISRPKEMTTGTLLKDGSIVSSKYLCLVDSNKCLENPFSLEKEASFYFIDNFFRLVDYQKDLITIYRYEYDVSKKLMLRFDIQKIDLTTYSSNYILSKNRLLLMRKSTNTWTVKNLLSGKNFEITQPLTNINQINSDMFYATFNDTSTNVSSAWILDFRQDTDGKFDFYPLKDSSGKIIMSGYLSGYDTFLYKANSDYIGIIYKKDTEVIYSIWSLNEKKNVKEIKFDRDIYTINLSGTELLFQVRNFDSTGKKLIQFTWIDLKTMKTNNLDLPQYQKISCSPSYRKFDYTLCTGLIDKKVQLLYWNSQNHKFDILSENIQSTKPVYGFLSINKNLALINFRDLSDIQAPGDLLNIYSQSYAEISSTSQTFVHRK